MALYLLVVLLSLCCGIRAELAKTFLMFEDQGPVPASVAVTVTPSRPLSCHSACLTRSTCLAFSMSSSTCGLYDTYMDDPNSQLHSQTGEIFFNIAPFEKVSLTTENTGDQNGGYANFFPPVEAGRVLRWKVQCGEVGFVWLAIWHGDITSSITLIGKHYVTIPSRMKNQLVTYDVPPAETVLVEAGDFVAFHYEDNQPEARVKVTDAEQTPGGDTIEWAYNLNIKDNALPVGRSLKPNDHRFRTPSVAVYIA